jgi:hypothetical protein
MPGIGFLEFVRPAQSLEPSLSISTKKTLRHPRRGLGILLIAPWAGAPAAPPGQAFGPSHGLPGWSAHTQPISWQSVHFIRRFIAAGFNAKGDTYEEDSYRGRRADPHVWTYTAIELALLMAGLAVVLMAAGVVLCTSHLLADRQQMAAGVSADLQTIRDAGGHH